MKITKYRLATIKGDQVAESEIETLVQDGLDIGFQPYGNPTIKTEKIYGQDQIIYFCQPMVKYENKTNNN